MENKMKKNRVFLLLLAAVSLVLLLGSCNEAERNRVKLVGTWEGDGTLDLMGMEMELGEELPFDVVEILHFAADGRGYMGDGEKRMEFTYDLTDDTLSFRFPDIGMGLVYKLTNDILTVSGSEFRRIA